VARVGVEGSEREREREILVIKGGGRNFWGFSFSAKEEGEAEILGERRVK